MHSQQEEVRTRCKFSFPDAVVSPATDSMSALRECVSELCQCGRDIYPDVHRQREDVCRQSSGSAQTRFRKEAHSYSEVTQRGRLRAG